MKTLALRARSTAALRVVSIAVPNVPEDQLAAWTQRPFADEDTRAKNAERLIREAIAAHPRLGGLGIDIYAKGSYANNTNVRRDSDIDIAVEYTDISYPHYGPDTDQEQVRSTLGIGPYTGPFRDAEGSTRIMDFKDAVGEALAETFGAAAVTRHNKVFTVRESSRSLAADVVPCTTYKQYWSPLNVNQGIRLLPDRPSAHWIVNYPRQHYRCGVAKNETTGRAFKRVVRILKNLENQMVDEGTIPAVSSFLIESLVYNCPDPLFDATLWAPRVRAVLSHIWEDTKESESEKRWLEVNAIKYLFHANQPWSRDEARRFTHAAWQYVAKS
ncbi:MAG TPA: nucleotidyltransferase [Solirubrobacterales bacterium]|jgi:predicted nucleotidyltransferase